MTPSRGTCPPWRVLVWPGGTEIGLEVRRALRDHKEVELVGGGSAADHHGPFAYRRWIELPDVSEDDWAVALNAAICEHAIDFVFPGHDDVLLALADARDRLAAAVVAPPAATCRVTRSKRATYAALGEVVRVPVVFDGPGDVLGYPVFVKPDRGQGSRGAQVVSDPGQLAVALRAGSNLIMEFLPGAEFTVDCFSSRSSGLLFARGRTRAAIRSGISGRSRSVREQEPFRVLARAIAERLELHGPWFFQVREGAEGHLTLLEVGPRVAGTMALHRITGVNFPLLALYEASGLPVTILDQALDVEIDRPLANRYRLALDYTTVYCDLDDMLLVRGRVNPRVVAFLYECMNRSQRLVLLTRHRLDIQATLRRHRLQALFDEVVLVADDEEKADHIADRAGILIDDSFRERLIAHERLGIATFDSSSLEALREDLA